MKKFIYVFLVLCLSFCLVACDININISHDDNEKTSINYDEEKSSNSKNKSENSDIIDNSKDPSSNFNDEVEKQILIVGTAVYEPYIFKDENGNWTGVEVDILNEIAKKINVDLVFEECLFDGIIGKLETGDVDLVATALSRTEERLEIANASIDIYPCFADGSAFFAVFYTSKDNPELTQAIDDAIFELQLDGVIDEILEKYNAY